MIAAPGTMVCRAQRFGRRRSRGRLNGASMLPREDGSPAYAVPASTFLGPCPRGGARPLRAVRCADEGTPLPFGEKTPRNVKRLTERPLARRYQSIRGVPKGLLNGHICEGL